ncbi:MAG: multicopper oxidase family protein, partial [Actinomycetota bacterium]
MELSRREMVKLGVVGSAALMLPLERLARTQLQLTNRLPESQLPEPFQVPFERPPVLRPVRRTDRKDFYNVSMRAANVEIIPGLRTRIWGYNGTFPGPTIKMRKGRRAIVEFRNRLPRRHPHLGYVPTTSVHLHGNASRPQHDGYASQVTEPGEYKIYRYPNEQPARTLWYHDHGVHHTAPNVYQGLAGFYITHDRHELSLPIPHGRYDVPLMITDAMFEKDGSLIYDDEGDSSLFGDVILVNGRPWPRMKVERRKYRFRVLNASISRSYDLALDSDEPLTVIGTDGGLMPHPVRVEHMRLGMAERYEIVIDFSKYKVGQKVVLRNRGTDNTVEFSNTDVIMRFDVVDDASDKRNNRIPEALDPRNDVMRLRPSDAVKTRKFEFHRQGGQWKINKTSWSDVINSGYRLVDADPELNSVEIWKLHNSSGGWFHPVHIHLIDFKILDRDGRPPRPYERGPKDVVYVG